jgi:predicted AlkP superfamily phosphohydrolase/phosphomutase
MKVIVIGLDCAAPELVFNEELPNFSKLRSQGSYGRLKSCIPAITIPAWMVMMTSKNPGKLGLYGFRHRKGYSYQDIWIANSTVIKQEALWDILKRGKRKVCLVGVPPSYPPFPVNGTLVSCFITPSNDKEYTYPAELKGEIENLVGEYIFDVPFRTEQRAELLSQIYHMTEQRFDVIKHLINHKEWDFFMWVEIGVDRIHHAFWKFYDQNHHLYQPGNEFEAVIPGYYRYLDDRLGKILPLIDSDTAVLVVSDHGAKGMKGTFCINEWLVKEGYLVLKTRPKEKVSLDKTEVDWTRTRAWGWGGYYSRIFLNVQGREPQGVIAPEDYEKEREEVAQRLKAITGPNGERWNTRVFKPEEIYPENNGDPPDLMVYLDDLWWRAAGTMGHASLHLPENDTGPDDAVHAEDGVFILYNPRERKGKEINSSIYDIAPTILHLMKLDIPQDMEGKSILPRRGKSNA